MTDTSEKMGVLSLPVLSTVGNPILAYMSKHEAIDLIENFADRVRSSRKLSKNDSLIDDTYFQVTVSADFDTPMCFGVDELLADLAESKIPTLRGERPVFIELNDDYSATSINVIVGTSVVYNRNWAALGVVDTSVIDTIEDYLEQ